WLAFPLGAEAEHPHSPFQAGPRVGSALAASRRGNFEEIVDQNPLETRENVGRARLAPVFPDRGCVTFCGRKRVSLPVHAQLFSTYLPIKFISLVLNL